MVNRGILFGCLFAAVAVVSNATANSPVQLRLPLVFEAAEKPAGPAIFTARGSGVLIGLASSAAQFNIGGDSFQLAWLGGNSSPAIAGEGLLTGRSHYFLGDNSANWRTNVPQYARVRYRNVYPNIDLVFYSRDGMLEYDFELAPGADPRQIRLSIEGSRDARLEPSGDLLITLPSGEIRQRRPRIYQESPSGRREIDGAYEAFANQEFRFRIGPYDPAQSLTIDPVLAFAARLGGSLGDGALAVTLDSAGNVYVAGGTVSTNFPVSPSYSSGHFSGTTGDIFIVKLDPSASSILFSVLIGGDLDDRAIGIALDSLGNIYVGATTESSNFPTTANRYAGKTGSVNAIAMKFNPTGSSLLYSTYLGGSSFDYCYSLAIDGSGNIYLGGSTKSTNFPTVNAYNSIFFNPIQSEGFVAKLNPNLSGAASLLYSSFIGGQVNGIAVDGSGMIYATGGSSFELGSTPGAYQTERASIGTPFVAKLNPAVSGAGGLLYSTYLGGIGSDNATAIALGPGGVVYVAGNTNSADFPSVAGSYRHPGIADDAFVVRLSPALTGTAALLSSVVFGGGNGDDVTLNGLALDAAGNAYLTGSTVSVDFPTAGNPFQASLGGLMSYNDAFVTKVSADGSSLIYSSYLGGSNYDIASAIAVDGAGNAYIVGQTQSSDFPVTAGVLASPHPGGAGDAFVVKVVPSATACSYSVDPIGANVGPLEGTGQLQVTTDSGCVWISVSNAPWLDVSSGQTGTGNGRVTYDWVDNPGLAPRSGTLTVGGSTFTVNQAGGTCSYDVVPSSFNLQGAGGPIQMQVVTTNLCRWGYSSNDEWITPDGPPGDRVGGDIVRFTVDPFYSGARVGRMVVAGRTVTVNQNGANQVPSVVSQSPAAGSSLSKTFTFVFTDPDGWQDLGVVNVLINNFLDGRHACYLAYDTPSNTLYLVNDAGTAISGMTLNGSGLLSNSQCTLNGVGASAVKSADRLTLKLPIAFNELHFGGQKAFYAAARDKAGNNTGWQDLGMWGVPKASPVYPYVVSMTPNSFTGTLTAFVLTIRDAARATNLSGVQLLINSALDGTHACYVGYDRANNLLYLVNDTGTALLPPVIPNSSFGMVENSQCRINGGTTFATVSGTDLQLSINMILKPGFAGRKIVYGAAQTATGGNSGWQVMGVATVQ